MIRKTLRSRRVAVTFALIAILLLPAAASDSKPHWLRIRSAHFTVLTDADQDHGHEVAVRFEQMRAAFGDLLSKDVIHIPIPLEIIACKDHDEYLKLAPARQAQRPGFFLVAEDRDYIALDLSQSESWSNVSADLAALLLNYNYPPTQPWFDEGVISYFSSIQLSKKLPKATIGADPQSGSLTQILQQKKWVPIADLFNTGSRASTVTMNSDQFRAQSWITMHYLAGEDKLSETGAYFGMVEMQKLPVDQAIQKAFGETSAQLEQAVRAHFDQFSSQVASPTAPPVAKGGGVTRQITVPDPITVGSSTEDVPTPEAQALVAGLAIRIPEHRDQALAELNEIIAVPKQDNAAAHRALALDAMQHQHFDQAAQELQTALELDPKNVAARFVLSLLKQKVARASGQPIQSLANMMQDLRFVLDADPEFAEADNLLGVARLQGGGINAAMEAMHAAILLSPRNERYQINMALIYIAAKKWDAASASLASLKDSSDKEVAQTAQKNLDALPNLKKYGLPPVTNTPAENDQSPSAQLARLMGDKEIDVEDDTDNGVMDAKSKSPAIDKRAVVFLKGRLVRVDCPHPPAAILTVSSGGKAFQFRTQDYKELALVGAEQFSCEWTNRMVSVNYKASSADAGDLVSLEVR